MKKHYILSILYKKTGERLVSLVDPKTREETKTVALIGDAWNKFYGMTHKQRIAYVLKF